MIPAQITVVSVVFEPEVGLLDLQARSMDRHVDQGLIREVLVIDNAHNGIGRGTRDSLLRSFGRFAGSVRFVRPGDLDDIPPATGWHVQQVLKLLVAREVTTSHYLVLDAKNQFIRPLRREFLFDDAGRPRMSVYGYRSHPHRARLEHVLRYLGVDPAPHVDHFTPTVTPYLLDRQLVLEMMHGIAERSGRSFAEEFVGQGLTEFFLYAGWVLATGGSLASRFDLDGDPCPTIWAGRSSDPEVHEVIERARSGPGPVLSIHRVAVGRLSPQASAELSRFWAECGLFADDRAAARYLRALRRQWQRTRWRLLAARVRDRYRELRVRDRAASRAAPGGPG